MRRAIASVVCVLAWLALAPAARAADYRCVGNRVEKSGSTVYTVRESSSGYAIEKAGSTKGNAVKRGDVWAIEVNGSTQATINGARIEKNNSTWALVADAKRDFDCPDVIAVALWVLTKNGQL